jgi:hypothetical protein
MKKWLLTIFLLLSTISFTQEKESYRLKLKKEGWMSLTIGGMAHTMGNMYFFYGYDLSDKRILQNFIIGNSVGLSMDIYSFTRFRKARKLKSKPKL